MTRNSLQIPPYESSIFAKGNHPSAVVVGLQSATGKLVIGQVIGRVVCEMNYQSCKWGEQHIRQQSVEGHLLVLQSELKEAIDGWMKNSTGRNSVESEITQVAAVAIQALINIELAKMRKMQRQEQYDEDIPQ